MIYPPVQALQALSRFQRLDAGDLVLTGTPVGTAISAPPKPVEVIGSLLPDQLKWRVFFSRQAKNRKYLRHGDIVEADELDFRRSFTPSSALPGPRASKNTSAAGSA